MKKREHRNHLFWSMLKSSMVMMLMPVLASIIIYVVLFVSLDRSSKAINSAALDNISVQVDKTFSNIYEATLALAESSQYRRIMAASDEPENSDLVEFQKILQNHTAYQPLISKTIVFMSGDMYISDTNYRTEAEFYEDDFFNYGIGTAQLAAEKNKYHDKDIQLRTLDATGAATNYSLLYQSITIGSNQYLSSVVLLIVDNDQLKAAMNNIVWSTGHLELVQGSAGIAAKGDSFTKAEYTADSSFADMQYRASGQSVYYSGAQTALSIGLAALTVLIIAAGGLVAAIVTKRNYKTINEIDRIVDVKSGTGSLAASLSDVAERVKDFADKYDDLQSLYRENFQSGITQLFLKILKGRPLPESRYSMCERYDIPYEDRKFVVVAITSYVISTYSRTLPEKELNEIQQVVYLAVKQHTDALFPDFPEKYLIDADRIKYVLLLSFPAGNDEAAELLRVKERCIEYRDAINREYKFSTSLTISAPAELKNLSMAYRQAEEAQSFIDLIGSENEVIFYGSIDGSESDTGNSSVDEAERQLANKLKSRDFDGAREVFDEIMDVYMPNVSKEFRVLRINSLVYGIVKNIREFSAFTEPGSAIPQLAVTLAGADTVSEQKSLVYKILEAADAYYKSGNDHSLETCGEIKRYIENNFSDPNLNVGMIADKFNFSLSYLSRMFKKTEDTGILEYIQKCRIDRAKELLKEKKNINLIAEEVGYLDSRTLIRAFKKSEGITPGKYR